jgi:excisionase family DNA binding protein
VTQKDAAEILGVSVKTVRRMIRKGQLPAVSMARREVIRRSDLDDLINGPDAPVAS